MFAAMENKLNLAEILVQENIKNFTVQELVRGNEIPDQLIMNIIPTVKMLQVIRENLGVPILVNSCFRSPEYNKKVGGAKNSLHLVFNAIDFKPKNYTSAELQDLYDDIDADKFPLTIGWNGAKVKVTSKVMGLGLYPSFIHLDTRGLIGRSAPARWDET